MWARLYEVRTSPLSLKLSLCDLCGLKGSLQSVCHDCHLKEDPTPNLHVPGSNIQAQLGVLHAVTAQPCLPLQSGACVSKPPHLQLLTKSLCMENTILNQDVSFFVRLVFLISQEMSCLRHGRVQDVFCS